MPDIRHAIPIAAAVERIADLVSSPEGLATWWAEDVTHVPASDAVELGFFDRTTIYQLVRIDGGTGIRWR